MGDGTPVETVAGWSGSKAYRVYNKRTNLVEESIHVSFHESNPCSPKITNDNDDDVIATKEIDDLTINEKEVEATQEESSQTKVEEVINQPQDINGENRDLPKEWRYVQNHPKELILDDPLKGEFEMRMMGELNFFLGLQIKQTTEGILVNQAKYAKELIKKFGMEGSKPMNTPMSTSTKLDKDENGKPVNEKMYRGRSKRLLSGTGPSEPQPDFNTQLFTNWVNEGNLASFKSRPIISGRQVSISPRYHHYIHDVITAAGWTEIMTVSNIVYPKLVRYFYCNLDIDRNADEYTLVSRVKGVDFVLDVSTMSSFLKYPVVERYQYVANDEELVDAVDDVSVSYQTITDDRVLGGGVTKNELKQHLRPLHLFIAHNVAPQKGHYDVVSPLQCLILHSLETHNYLNLSYLILKEMGSILQNNHKALPYGALLTKLFLSAKVRIQGEQTLKNDPGPIKDYTFTRGHISDDEEGDFTTQIFARFDALQASQNQMLAAFQNFAIAQNSRFDSMEHRMDHIDQAQQHYFSHYHRQYPDFVPYPPYHPPSPPQWHPTFPSHALIDDVSKGEKSLGFMF
ncbi:hypothetical protein RHSIM_RhsimUnG0016700 [Rhododendron simsii]|uniref:Reverse transcriptase Ty1/copia-type domain-containing protein n=1 Tax=Rhododendron simsii TaxID=118357 RepID=A0A834FWP5_RHOSS|nr:hypothetical protein RHSIM_RhsimUnG0016700 [Rhododendron simsii]